MSPAKIEELFDLLRAACARQFRFNQRRITAGMRYVGKEGHGKDLVHVFRDATTHSQIVLDSTFATLREKHGDKPHWTEAEKARYQASDAEIDAEIAARQAELEFTRNSALYLDHKAQLLTHYKEWPGYQPGGTSPREAARLLIVALAEAGDARLAAYAEHVGATDPEHLAHLLLSPCHLEIEASKAAAST
ncbi:MAG: hypothetical protein KKE51_17695 [Gammaproteobacteria bacterium]|nr:hypothetical protein [Gammaproteobacteria bacterium]MBU1601448.1 hypothetical protein [Gammaproteobacteria bacterium]MBU2433643.1 hypothetical protein [Gammaproteobacteria bacterium]MBU2449819.1 hypothetical protein [Gammaproteobacteria bacterium]